MSLNIKVSGLHQLKRYLTEYSLRKRKELKEVVTQTVSKISSDAKSFAPVDLADLRSGIKDKVKDYKSNIIGEVLSSVDYSQAVEHGSKPHWTSIKNLVGWAERHGIPAYAVQYKIAKEGTPAQPYMLPAFMKNKNKFVRDVTRVIASK